MRSSFELINEVVIPNLHNKDRILVGINRCDLALDGKGWIEKYNYPNEELLQRLKEKSDSVRRRIKEDTGVDVEPIFYSALYKYNISKLLSHLVKSAPTRKRIFFAEKINKNPDNFLRDDTMSLVKKNTVQERADRWPQGWYRNNLYNSSNQNNVYDSNADKIYEEVTHIKSQMSGIERKIETIHTDIKLQAETIPSTAQEETDDDMESEYELIKTDETQYKEEFQSSMEEAFEAASTELNEESKEKIKFSFVDMLDDMKTGIIKGAEAGIELGKRVPFISATVGSAIGAVLGGVGGFLTNVFKKKK